MRAMLWPSLSLFAALSMAPAARAISHGGFVAAGDPIKAVTVSVYSDDDDCTGVKVAARFVLTARHCLVDKSTRVIFADGRLYKIIGVFAPRPKRVTVRDEHDLAVLKLADDVPGPSAELADDATTPKNGESGWIAGYGGRKAGGVDDPLRKLQVKMTDRDYSPSAVAVRTAADGAACDGDSGGPGYTERDNRIVVWGIDSAPLDGNSRCASREVLAKVAAERDWIKQTLSLGERVGSRF
jgi:hypothetical protein